MTPLVILESLGTFRGPLFLKYVYNRKNGKYILKALTQTYLGTKFFPSILKYVVIFGEFSFAILLQKLVMTDSNFKNRHDFNNDKKNKRNNI